MVCHLHNVGKNIWRGQIVSHVSKISKDFWLAQVIINCLFSSNLGHQSRPSGKKRTCYVVVFAVLADDRVKIKENEVWDKYLDLARELKKKQWSMIVTVIPIVIGLVRELEELKIGGRIESIQTTALLRSARILRRVLETWGNLLSIRLKWKTIS